MCRDSKRNNGPDAYMLVEGTSATPTIEVINADGSATLPREGSVTLFFRLKPQFAGIRTAASSTTSIIPTVSKKVQFQLRPDGAMMTGRVTACLYDTRRRPSVGRIKVSLDGGVAEPVRSPAVVRVRQRRVDKGDESSIEDEADDVSEYSDQRSDDDAFEVEEEEQPQEGALEDDPSMLFSPADFASNLHGVRAVDKLNNRLKITRRVHHKKKRLSTIQEEV
jgi:hypothetical protein